jgi:hypothetical protein
MGLQQGFTTGGTGSDRHFARQQSQAPHVRFGSKADIPTDLSDVRFTKRTSELTRGMSALCQKRTLVPLSLLHRRRGLVMSAAQRDQGSSPS